MASSSFSILRTRSSYDYDHDNDYSGGPSPEGTFKATISMPESPRSPAVPEEPEEDHFSHLVTSFGFTTYFTAVVVAYWDDRVGPNIGKVWVGSQAVTRTPALFTKLLQFISRTTLSGELSPTGEINAEPNLYILEELECVLLSFVFYGDINFNASTTLFSISLVLPIKKLSSYLSIQQLCTERVRLLVKQLLILLHKSATIAEGIELLAEVLKPLLLNLNSTGISSADIGADLSRTIFHSGQETKFDRNFFKRAVTSLMQTGGVGVVVARDKGGADLMIESLALFLDQDQRGRSRYGVKGGFEAYAPDLVLQGLVQEDKEAVLDPSPILHSHKATTLINIDNQSVKQTKRLNEFNVLHQEMERAELAKLRGEGGDQALAPQIHEFFHSVTTSAPLVVAFLNEVFLPYPSRIREMLIVNFRRIISRKALVLIKLSEAEGASPSSPLAPEKVEKLKKDTQLMGKGDLEVVLAWSEKLRKGMYETVLGDPSINEQQLMELLSSF